MCGIAGRFGPTPFLPETVAVVRDRLASRGPDARCEKFWSIDFRPSLENAANCLIHTRLSIIDPRPTADQPMSNDAGDVWICYNGEVYDWHRQKNELVDLGYGFRTQSDTEFILHAYEAWGPGMLPRLRGMFAFAVLDLRRRKVFLARDRMGKKPLLYYHFGGEFAFASTVRALLPWLPPDRRTLSTVGIDAYLAHRYIPAPTTIFAEIRRLPNGHCMEFDLDSRRLVESRYWQPEAKSGDWRGAIDEAVEVRTASDRPVGVFLSGGVDSTVIATRLAALGRNDITAFTASFPGNDMDEAGLAAIVARSLGMPHIAVEVPRHLGGDFARIVADLDEPFADPSSFPLWYLARETSRHVKVVLAGDGGDELFAGYKRYRQHLRSSWRGTNFLPLTDWPAAIRPSKLERLREELALDWISAYTLRFSGFDPVQRRWLQPDLNPLPGHYWRLPPELSDRKPLEQLLAVDLENYLPEYILRKGDLTTMAHGLELRAPLLDHKLHESILALPDIERFTRPAKTVLSSLCSPCRDLELFERKKRGFNPPLALWLREDLCDRIPKLGQRLEASSHGQLHAARVDMFVEAYIGGAEELAENLLQLFILDESLAQLEVM